MTASTIQLSRSIWSAENHRRGCTIKQLLTAMVTAHRFTFGLAPLPSFPVFHQFQVLMLVFKALCSLVAELSEFSHVYAPMRASGTANHQMILVVPRSRFTECTSEHPLQLRIFGIDILGQH